jgi:hypothetical protein
VAILLCKLALAPAFVVALSIAVRRFGPRVGGVLGGLPVVAGPILFIYALDRGTPFAADAAANSLIALSALGIFVVVVAAAAGWGERRALATTGRSATPVRLAVISVIAGWLAYAVVAAVVAALDVPPGVGLLVDAIVFLLCLSVLPQPDPAAPAVVPQRPPFDLTIRAGVAAVMVLALTSLAGQLGPTASGVLAPFPTITSVLAGFAIAHESRDTTLRLLRGILRGFFSFAAALFVLAVALDPLGIPWAFLNAIIATSVVQVVLLTVQARPLRAEAGIVPVDEPSAAVADPASSSPTAATPRA